MPILVLLQVLLSLNGIEDVKARLLSKVRWVLSSDLMSHFFYIRCLYVILLIISFNCCYTCSCSSVIYVIILFCRYLLSNRKKVIWDFSITTVTIKVPWRNMIMEECNLVIFFTHFVSMGFFSGWLDLFCVISLLFLIPSPFSLFHFSFFFFWVALQRNLLSFQVIWHENNGRILTTVVMREFLAR